MTGSKAGWLRFTDNKWVLTTCEFGRIRQKDIIDSLKINENDWKKATSVPVCTYQICDCGDRWSSLKIE